LSTAPLPPSVRIALPNTVSVPAQHLQRPLTFLCGKLIHQSRSTPQRFVVETQSGKFTAIIPQALRNSYDSLVGNVVVLEGILRRRQQRYHSVYEIMVKNITPVSEAEVTDGNCPRPD
jgi:hypothetical protein